MPPERDLLAEALSAERLPEQMRVRRAKMDRLKAQGIDPYPVGYPRTHTLAQVRADSGELPPDTHTGRDGVDRRPGAAEAQARRIGFATLRDGSGDLQVLVSRQGGRR